MRGNITISPGSGWGNIHLGDSFQEVRDALTSLGYEPDLGEEPFVIDIMGPETTFYFDDSKEKRLVQIVFYGKDHLVKDQPVIGLSLAEALLPFRIRSYEESLWSLVSIEEEFRKGKPLPNGERIRTASVESKLECGTLWIKGQGVGLVMLFGVVHALALRKPGSEPSVGCGPLDAKAMTLALSEEATRDSEGKRTRNFPSALMDWFGAWSLRKQVIFFARLVVMGLALVMLILPVGIVYRDFTAWSNSKSVMGRVVSMTPEGPFPDELVVEYSVTEADTHRVTIPVTYASVRDLEEEVLLYYLPEQPHLAMTPSQMRDEGLSASPLILLGSMGLGFCFLYAAVVVDPTEWLNRRKKNL